MSKGGQTHLTFHPKIKVSKIEDEIIVMIAASDLKYNMLDLEDMSLMPEWGPETIASGHVSCMPNPDRALAGGNPIYSAFIDIFGDDVSGNQSKSWNKHWNIYITHQNLPRKLLFQQCHIHFTSTSTYATVPEQFHGIKEVIELEFSPFILMISDANVFLS